MTNHDFEVLLTLRVQKIQSVLASKAKEYASDDDRLHNFKVAARIDDETPKKALWGMLKKHLVSVMDMVNSAEDPSWELVDEKVGDAVNYFILLEAVLKETLI